MFGDNVRRSIPVAAWVFVAAFLLTAFTLKQSLRGGFSVPAMVNLATPQSVERYVLRRLLTPSNAAGTIIIDYPQDGSIFPPEILSPTFIWRDTSSSSVSWRIDIAFADGAKPLKITTPGPPMQIGEIDPRCISETNQLPSLTVEQAAAHTWKPEPQVWALIKQHSAKHPAKVSIEGIDAMGRSVTGGLVALSTSTDPVDGQIFYRDVPLMPAAGAKGIIQPLAQAKQPLINWRLRDLAKPESRVVMHDMYTCANCHSFSSNGKWMGMDVDGPNNDKGLYAVVPVKKEMVIRNEDLVAWNTDRSVGKTRVGFMSQVSPDGKYILSTFAGPGETNPTSYYVTNFTDYRFLQVFYPTRGVLTWYSRETGLRKLLPGASDPRYSQGNAVWSPDGKYIVFARAEAQDPYPSGHPPALAANDPNEIQIKYSLYRIPFNNGLGGKAERIEGASDNGMSNNFPKISPDGKWLVFVKCHNGLLMRPDSELWIVPAAGGVARRMKCNTSLMNSWHSFSPNGRWLVFSSKSRSPYTQMFITHIDANGNDSAAIYIDNSTAANRAVNIPEFVNIAPDGIEKIDVPLSSLYRVIDEATELGKQHDRAGAIAKWREAVAMDSNSAQANNGLGMALGMRGKPGDAIPYLEKATQIDSEFFDAYFNLGTALTAEKRIAEATDAWQNALRIRPGFLQGRENLGYAYFKQAKFADALAQLRIELTGAPNRVFALNLAAKLLATCPDDSVRNGVEALKLADQAKQLTGGKIPAVLDTVAEAYAESGDFARAVESDSQALDLATGQGDQALASKITAHLAKYASNQPIRDPEN